MRRTRRHLGGQVTGAYNNSDFVAEVAETRRVSGERLKELDGKDHPEFELYPLQIMVAQIKVLKRWKGAATVDSLESGYVGSTCGNVQYHAGDRLLLYAAKTEIAGRVGTWSCARTGSLAALDQDIVILDGLTAKHQNQR